MILIIYLHFASSTAFNGHKSQAIESSIDENSSCSLFAVILSVKHDLVNNPVHFSPREPGDVTTALLLQNLTLNWIMT